MPKMKPASVSASGMRFAPTNRTMDRVITWMAPVCFRASAIIDPSTMTTPILPSVLPKPFSKALMKLFRCTPGITPNRMIGSSKAEKTCHFHFAISRSSRAMTRKKPISARVGFVVTAVGESIFRSMER